DRELPKHAESFRCSGEQRRVTRVKGKGLPKVSKAFIPISLASGNSPGSKWGLAAAWPHFSDATERGFGRAEFRQDHVLIIPQGEQGFRRVRLEFLRSVQRFFRCIAPKDSTIVTIILQCAHRRKPRPGERKVGVKLYRLLEKLGGLH